MELRRVVVTGLGALLVVAEVVVWVNSSVAKLDYPGAVIGSWERLTPVLK